MTDFKALLAQADHFIDSDSLGTVPLIELSVFYEFISCA